MDFLQYLFNEDEWRKRKAMQLPAPKYTDSNPMPFLERMQSSMPTLHQKHMQIDDKEQTIYKLLQEMDQLGQQQGIGKVPRNLLELFDYLQQDDIRRQQQHGLINQYRM